MTQPHDDRPGLVLAEPLGELLREYLTHHGWTSYPPGPAGAIWTRTGEAFLAVPDRIPSKNSVEWRSVIERLAAFEKRPAVDVALTVQFQMTDVTHMRAAHDIVIAGSIPLTAGASLVSSARTMLRAAATNSVRPRPNIAGHFSKIADAIADKARLGHTREGSYVIPLLMPLTRPEDTRPEQPPVPGMEIERSPIEPAERRVTRTLAQALAAVDTTIVQPARQPRRADLNAAVVAGASREIVTALHRVLADPNVAVFEATFDWADAVGDPGGVPSRIEVSAEAVPLLDEAARLLKTTSYSPDEVITGPIVEVRHEPDEPFGHISVQTVRRGRRAEIRVRLTLDKLNETYDWARDGRPVLVEGRVRRSVGRPLTIDRPRNVQPLDETYLPIADA